MTDADIIQSVLSGDKDAYAELVRRHHVRVLAVCGHLLQIPSEAEDAAQDVFVLAYKRLSSFRGDSAFSTWMYRIATNYCLDLLRKRKREKSDSIDRLIEEKKDASLHTLHFESGPETVMERKDLVTRLLSRLNENERTILILREAEGFSYQEIAAILEISIDAVKARLKRARQSLQEKTRHLFKIENV